MKFNIPNTEPFRPPDIDWDKIEFEPIQKGILEELQKNNEKLSTANQELINTLRDQHNTNLSLQRSNGRISIANLILAVLSVGSAFWGVYQSNQDNQITLKLIENQEEIRSISDRETALQIEILELKEAFSDLQEIQKKPIEEKETLTNPKK